MLHHSPISHLECVNQDSVYAQLCSPDRFIPHKLAFLRLLRQRKCKLLKQFITGTIPGSKAEDHNHFGWEIGCFQVFPLIFMSLRHFGRHGHTGGWLPEGEMNSVLNASLFSFHDVAAYYLTHLTHINSFEHIKKFFYSLTAIFKKLTGCSVTVSLYPPISSRSQLWAVQAPCFVSVPGQLNDSGRGTDI